MLLRYMRFLIYFLLLTSVGLVRAEEDIPTIYYYSSAEQAFVTQSTNGEKQVLFPFSQDEESVINGSGWSPSGQWFMWYEGLLSTQGFIASNSKRETHQFYNGERDTPVYYHLYIFDSLWHPTDDLILLHISTQAPDGGETFIRIYDPNEDRYVLDVNITEKLGLVTLFDVKWSSDGNNILIDNRRELIVIDRAGNVISRIDSQHNPNDGCGELNLPIWFDDDTLIHKSSDELKLILTNVNEQSTESQFDFSPHKPSFVDISPDNRYLLVYSYNPEIESSNCSRSVTTYSLWLVSLEEETITLIHDSVKRDYHLPEALSAWNNSDSFFFVIYDELTDTRNLAIYSILDSQTTNIEIPSETVLRPTYPIRWYENDLIFIWSPVEDSRSIRFARYNIEDQITSFAMLDNRNDITYSSIENDNLIIGNQLIDVSNRTIQEFNVNQTITSSLPVYIDWHPSGKWFLSWGDVNSSPNRSVRIGDIESLTINEVTICAYTPACYGWMPENSEYN